MIIINFLCIYNSCHFSDKQSVIVEDRCSDYSFFFALCWSSVLDNDGCLFEFRYRQRALLMWGEISVSMIDGPELSLSSQTYDDNGHWPDVLREMTLLIYVWSSFFFFSTHTNRYSSMRRISQSSIHILMMVLTWERKDHTNPVRHSTEENTKYNRTTFNLCFWQALIGKWRLERIPIEFFSYLFRHTSSTSFHSWRWLRHGNWCRFWWRYIC